MILNRAEMRQRGCLKLHTGAVAVDNVLPQRHRARWSMEIYQKRRLSRYPLFCGRSCRDVFVRAKNSNYDTTESAVWSLFAWIEIAACDLVYGSLYTREKRA